MFEPRMSFGDASHRHSAARLSVGHSRPALPDMERWRPANACENTAPLLSERELQALDGVRDALLAQQAEAVATADGCGKSDLRRLQRQFTALKNTFMHSDVKVNFIDALMTGALPQGDERAVCELYQQEAEDLSSLSKDQKAQNAQVTAEIQRLIADTARAFEEHQARRGQVAATMEAAARDEAALAAPEQPLPPVSEGPSEVECQQLLEALAGDGRQMEASCAATEAACAHEEGEMQAAQLAAERHSARAAELARGRHAQSEHDGRFAAVAQQAEALCNLVSDLSGVQVLECEDDSVDVQLTTHQGEELNPGPTSPAPAARLVTVICEMRILDCIGVQLTVHQGGCRLHNSDLGSNAVDIVPLLQLLQSRFWQGAIPAAAAESASETRWRPRMKIFGNLLHRHQLTMQLDEHDCPVSAKLEPATVDVADIVAASCHSTHSMEFVVREVRVHLAAAIAQA